MISTPKCLSNLSTQLPSHCHQLSPGSHHCPLPCPTGSHNVCTAVSVLPDLALLHLFFLFPSNFVSEGAGHICFGLISKSLPVYPNSLSSSHPTPGPHTGPNLYLPHTQGPGTEMLTTGQSIHGTDAISSVSESSSSYNFYISFLK